MIKVATVLTSALILSGCDTVQLMYKAPSSDSATVLADAQSGYHYFELPRTYILVTPATAAENKGAAGHVATPGKPVAANVDPSTTMAAAGEANTVPTINKSRKQKNGSGTKNNPQQRNDGAGNNASNGNTNSQNSTGTGDQGTSDIGATINGTAWSAKAIPMPDSKFGLLVKGRVSFWQSTTLGIARYSNSDMPSSISSNAKDLTATRIGQMAGAVANIVSVLGVLGVDNTGALPASTALEPFSIAVTNDSDQQGTLSNNWSWTLTFDDDAIKDAVTFQDFLTAAVPASQTQPVSYWPVPACRTATLTVIDNNTLDDPKSYPFHLVVGTPENIRPEALPVNGSLNLGTVCSGSTKSTTGSDPIADASSDLAAFQKAVAQLKHPSASKTTASSGAN